MPIDAANLFAYAAQITCIVPLGGLAARLLPIDAAGARCVFWRALLVLCLALPLLQDRAPAGSVTIDAVSAQVSGAESEGISGTVGTIDRAEARAYALLDSTYLYTVLIAGAALRLAWLTAGLVQLRRLRRTATRVCSCDEYDRLQETLGTRAEIREHASVAQPVTFGTRRPVILLPASLRARSEDVRRAVVAHELLHVQRRDWGWVCAEELVRAAFWFHPAMWWLISRVQLAREEVVDELGVLATGRRRAYAEALLAFSGAPPHAPAAAFARRPHLFRRVMLISKEARMSSRQIVGSSAALALVVLAGSWYAVDAFPLRDTPAGVSDSQHGPGPLERQAKPVTPENPIPRRLLRVDPVAPAGPAGYGAQVTIMATLDRLGHVAEARAIGLTANAGFRMNLSARGEDLQGRIQNALAGLPAGDVQAARTLVTAIVAAAQESVRQWAYDPPVDGPIAFPVTVEFGTMPRPSAPDAARKIQSAAAAGALRIGGNIAPPKRIAHVSPIYPEAAKAAGLEGVVILEVLVGPDGTVTDAQVLRSIPLLDQAALDAVYQWQYTPTLLNGQPVPVVMTITVNFTLRG